MIALFVGGTAAAQQAPALAEPGRPTAARLLLPACDALPFDREALVSVLGVELLASSVVLQTGQAAPVPGGEVLIVVDVPGCGAGGRRVDVRVERPGSGPSAARSLEVTEQSGPVQSRVLALAIAELLRTELERPAAGSSPSAAGPEATGPIEPEPARPPPPVRQAGALERDVVLRPSRPAGDGRPQVLVDALIESRVFAGFGGGQIGFRVGASMPIRRIPLRLDVDLGGWYGLGFDPLGSIDIGTLLLGATLAWAGGSEALGVEVGPRVELGWGRAAGRAADSSSTRGESFDALVSTLTVRAALRARLGALVALLVDVQVGYVLSGLEARADDRRAAGVGGPVIAVGVGLSFLSRRSRR
jgi:hypothetical protein